LRNEIFVLVTIALFVQTKSGAAAWCSADELKMQTIEAQAFARHERVLVKSPGAAYKQLKAIPSQSLSTAGRWERQRWYMRMYKPADALADIDVLCLQGQSNPDFLLRKAEILVCLDRKQEAKQLCLKAVSAQKNMCTKKEIEESNSNSLLKLLSNPHDIKRTFISRRRIDDLPVDILELWRRSSLAKKSDDFKDSLSYIKKAAERAPWSSFLAFEAAQAYRRVEDFKNSLAEAERCINLHPKYFEAYDLKASICADNGEPGVAIKCLDLMIENDFDKAKSLVRRAECFNALNKPDLALADLKKMEKQPRSRSVLAKARAYELLHDKNMAIKILTDALPTERDEGAKRPLLQMRLKLFKQTGNKVKASADKKELENLDQDLYKDAPFRLKYK